MLRTALRLTILLSIVVSARSVLADHYHVPTGSMEPTVAVGDRIAVNKAAYGLRLPLVDDYLIEFDGPRRGDVVVLASPDDGDTLLKRVVALPGDRVEVLQGRLTINGVSAMARDETVLERLDGKMHRISLAGGGGPDLSPSVVPEGHYLVMGDNRGNSHDGREFGWVHRDAIRGRAVAVFHGERQGFTWRAL